MINPNVSDIGRKVIYRARHLTPTEPGEEGVITSLNPYFVFVRFGADTNAKATRREELFWP